MYDPHSYMTFLDVFILDCLKFGVSICFEYVNKSVFSKKGKEFKILRY